MVVNEPESYDNYIDEFFSEIDSDILKKKINQFIVKPILGMLYNELFPYICIFTIILIICILLLLFVVFILSFSK
jgi:hypothetical protein